VIGAVLFDKDGTLVDYWRTWVPINREVALFAAGGDAALADELLARGGQDPATGSVIPGSVLAAGSHDEIAAAFAQHLGSRTPRNLATHVERIFAEAGAKGSVLIEGAVGVLLQLERSGFQLGIATNDSIAGLEGSLGRHGLLHHFRFLAGCDSGYGAKPAAQMALAFCHAVDLPPSNVAIIGDAVHDLEMGRRAGLGLKIGILGGTSRREDLAPHADVIIASLRELPPLLIR